MGIPNGGPPLDDESDAKLRWVKLNITEMLEGMEELTFEQRGFYMTALLKMYARMGGLPADDRAGSVALRCNPRTFRLLRDKILATGKFYIEDGVLKNSRVDREIADYVREHKRRREQALKREQQRREAREGDATNIGWGRIQPEFEPNSSPIRAELEPNSSPIQPEFEPNRTDLCNEINGGATTELVRGRTTNQNHQPEPEPEREEKSRELTLSRPQVLDLEPVEVLASAGRLRPATASADPIASEAVQSCFDAWNELAARIGLAQARLLTPKRAKAIKARLKEHGGLAAWGVALGHIERSSFLQGGGSRGWKADLDFLLQPGSFTKVFEGTFGNGAHAAAAKETYLERLERMCNAAEDRITGREIDR